MKYFKNIIFPILWIPLLCVSLFASPSLEDMTINAEYIGIVNIEKVQNASVASVRMGWNTKSEDNVSRYVLETINTIKGDVPAVKNLIMDIWQKDYFGKTIKPLAIGEQVLVFLVKFKPLSGAWVLEEKLGHLTPIADYDACPNDSYYGIRPIKEDGMIDIMGKPYTVSQIKNIINVCNSTKFKELQNRARLLRDKSQYADALKLFQDAYKMCPTAEVSSGIRFVNETLEEKKLSWQIERAGLPTLLFETLFFLLFFAMGYYGKWRWTGMLFVVYIFPLIYLLSLISEEIHLVARFLFILPFVSYGLGMLLYRAKKGTWPTDKVSEEMAAGFLSGEDADGSYVVWENEVEVMHVRTLVILSAVFAGAVYLANHPFDDAEILKTLGVIVAVLSGGTLFSVLLLMNRIRYRYGCYDGGYGYAITDSRYLGSSSASIAAGVSDGDLTLAGAGFLAKGGLGSMRREWSSVKWCKYDDNKKIIVINHGCCKSDKLYASDRSYNGLKAIVMKSIGEKCTGINKKRSEGSKDVK